jgi:hypothetical protein
VLTRSTEATAVRYEDHPDCAAAVDDAGGLTIFQWPDRLVVQAYLPEDWASVEVIA